MKSASRRALRRLLIPAVAALGMAGSLHAAEYPNRPIKLVVPAPPAGTIDIMARLLAAKLSQAWKQPVVVENRHGAHGMIGTAAVAKSAPDGYTVLITVAALVGSPHLYPKLPYDIFKDFSPVAMLASTSVVLAVGPAMPASTLEEFVQLARARPRQYSYASPGAGSAAHVYGETLNAEAGLKLLHVPYKGEAAMVNDLLGGNVSAAFVSASVLIPHAAAGKLRLLATTGPRRLPMFPNLPTFGEAGYAGFDSDGWVGLLVPAGTPKEIIERLATQSQQILREPEVANRLAELGYVPRGASAPEFAAVMKADYLSWGARIRRASIKLD